MARWKVTISGKGVKKASVDALVAKVRDKFGEKVSVSVEDASPPESRADRFSEAVGLISDAVSELEGLRDELQEWKDGMPENLQSGSKAEEIDQAISDLEDIISEGEDLAGRDVTFPGMY